MNMNLQDIIKPYIKVLNFTLSQKFKWFKKIELEDIKYGGVRGQQNFINPVGKIYVDSDWGHKQWKEYHYESPFPYDEEISFGDMIGRDLSEKIQEQFKLCFSMVSGEIVPKYMSFSWLDVELVDEQENMLEESIRRILREEMEFSVGFRRRIETFKAIVWNNFATDYPCDYDDFSHFMRGVRQEIIDAILEGENDGAPISDWLTLKEAEDYIEKYMINELKEFYVSRCLE